MRYLIMFAVLAFSLPAAAVSSREEMAQIMTMHCRNSVLSDEISVRGITEAGLTVRDVCDCVGSNFAASLTSYELVDAIANDMSDETFKRAGETYTYCLKAFMGEYKDTNPLKQLLKVPPKTIEQQPAATQPAAKPKKP